MPLCRQPHAPKHLPLQRSEPGRVQWDARTGMPFQNPGTRCEISIRLFQCPCSSLSVSGVFPSPLLSYPPPESLARSRRSLAASRESWSIALSFRCVTTRLFSSHHHHSFLPPRSSCVLFFHLSASTGLLWAHHIIDHCLVLPHAVIVSRLITAESIEPASRSSSLRNLTSTRDAPFQIPPPFRARELPPLPPATRPATRLRAPAPTKCR